jgi:hypothetical protein
MTETKEAVEADVRAQSEHRLREELREAEARIRADYDVRIEEAVQAAVVAAELAAHDEELGRLEPYLMADIEDEAVTIRARHNTWVQHEVEARLAAQERRHATRITGTRQERGRAARGS